MKSKGWQVLGILMLGVFLTIFMSGCDLLLDLIFPRYTLTVDINGEGTVEPLGEHVYEPGTVVTLEVSAEDPWEFYAWAGENAAAVVEQNDVYKITMDSDMNITAFFAKDFYEFTLTPEYYMGSGGTAEDLTNNPPYPPGFEIELLAEPETDEDAFLYWGTTAGDPRDFFDDYESKQTRYTVPEESSTVIPYFTRRTVPTDPGEFHYDHNDFNATVTGEVGVTEHYWDLSEVTTNQTLDFYFQARNIPDRFRVFYGDWEELELLFCSGWVSINPQNYQNLPTYPEGVYAHDWHEEVELDFRLTFIDSAGGKFEGLITRQAGKEVLMVQVEGRDSGTIWDYVVNTTD